MLIIESYLPAIAGGGDSPNTIKITLPGKSKVIQGLLDGDVTVSFQNRFGSLIPDISGLADLAQVFNMTSMPAWIGASAQAWKGTDPIRISTSFYLIRYTSGLAYEQDLEDLAKMCAMSRADSLTGGTSAWTVKVHGGYQPNFLDNNSQFFDKAGEFTGNMGDWAKNVGESVSGQSTNGTIKIKVGTRLTLNNLLLTKLDVTSSIIEVRHKKPLYYRVDAHFQTCRAALSTDIEGMFS